MTRQHGGGRRRREVVSPLFSKEKTSQHGLSLDASGRPLEVALSLCRRLRSADIRPLSHPRARRAVLRQLLGPILLINISGNTCSR